MSARRLDYGWRLLATGTAFAALFCGGGLLAVTLLPLLALLPGGRRRRAQKVIHSLFRVYIWVLRHLGLIDLQTEGAERLARSKGRLVVANHPSLLDVVMLMAIIPNAQCIVKHELWTHRLLGPLMRRAGYIRNDLEPAELVERCRDALAQGCSLIIFPEGTRTSPGARPHFRRGFANLATLTGVPVQLVVITCDPPTLTKGEPWWCIPPQKPRFRLVAAELLDVRPFTQDRCRSLAARKLVKFVDSYFAEKLGYV